VRSPPWSAWWRARSRSAAICGLEGRRDLDVRESGGFQAFAVLGEREGTGDATNAGAALGLLGGREVVVSDNVGDVEATTGTQDAEGFVLCLPAQGRTALLELVLETANDLFEDMIAWPATVGGL
jgi:hypothetical protein